MISELHKSRYEVKLLIFYNIISQHRRPLGTYSMIVTKKTNEIATLGNLACGIDR